MKNAKLESIESWIKGTYKDLDVDMIKNWIVENTENEFQAEDYACEIFDAGYDFELIKMLDAELLCFAESLGVIWDYTGKDKQVIADIVYALSVTFNEAWRDWDVDGMMAFAEAYKLYVDGDHDGARETIDDIESIDYQDLYDEVTGADYFFKRYEDRERIRRQEEEESMRNLTDEEWAKINEDSNKYFGI